MAAKKFNFFLMIYPISSLKKVAHRGQLSNQIIDRLSKIYELKGLLNISMLQPAILPNERKVAI